MGIDIKRGYEILPNNDVRFGVKVTNNDESVISDVQIILDHNESLFKLQGDMVRELDNIPPGIARTAEFILKPLGCVHKENIEATITYRDYRWQKHIVPMRPKEVHCVCPFLRPRAMSRSEFLHIYNRGHSIETGVNFEGIEASEIIAFLMQTCATRLYVVEAHSMGQDSVINFSGEAAGEKTYYLLIVLVKENDGMTRVMLRAVSDKTHGLNGFINEIISELRLLANTVSSAREIGIIKHEQVINIIDSVVQRSNITNGNDAASINIEDSVVQRTNIHAPRSVPSDANDTHLRSGTAVPENMEEDDEDISNMYNTYLEDVKAINAKNQRVRTESSEADLQDKARARRQASERGSLYNSLRMDENAVKKRRYDSKKILLGLTVVAVLLSTYFLATPLIKSYPAEGEIVSTVDYNLVEPKVKSFLNAVNAGDSVTAYNMHMGKDFSTPADITTVFLNEGIERGSIRDINVILKKIAYRQALVETRCYVSIKDTLDEEEAVSTIPIYFELRHTGSEWIITSVSFHTPPETLYSDKYVSGVLALEEETNDPAVKTTSSSLMVKNIEGVRAKNSAMDMSDTIDLLKLKVGLNVGSAPVDIEQIVVSIKDGTATNTLIYAGNDASGYTMEGFSTSSASQNLKHLLTKSDNPKRYFTVEKIRDEDASFSQTDPLMNTGDLITLYIATTSGGSTGYFYVGTTNTPGLKPSDLNLVPRTVVNIVITPASGMVTTADFVTPSAYGVKETVALYP